MTFGEIIKARRESMQFTIDQLARKLDRSPTIIRKWEKGEATPQLRSKEAICGVLSLDQSTLEPINFTPKGLGKDFSWALEQILKGKKVFRPSWGASKKSVKAEYLYLRVNIHGGPSLTKVRIVTLMGDIRETITTWNCSHSDILAQDWEEYKG